MNNAEIYPIIIATIFVWIGFVLAISFMESWLKFKAPGITIPLGLGIGKLVFNALNKIEWLLAGIIITCLLLAEQALFISRNIFFFIPFLILILQSIWLLPVLNRRATQRISGYTTAKSNLHLYFILAELLKIGFLISFGIITFTM